MTARLTPEELADARRLCNEATPGPWRVEAKDEDFVFACVARDLALRLLDEVEALQQDLDYWQRQYDHQVQVTTVRIEERDEARAALARRASYEESTAKQLHAVEHALSQFLVERDRLRVAADRLADVIGTLFAAIKHGDYEHEAWLREAIDEHFGAALAAYREATKP